MAEDRSCCESFLQGPEGFLGLQGPAECDILLEQGREGCNYAAVFIDELLVEVGESEEDLNIVLGLWSRPRGYYVNFLQVHSYSMRTNKVPEEGYFFNRELALLRLGVKACLSQLFQN